MRVKTTGYIAFITQYYIVNRYVEKVVYVSQILKEKQKQNRDEIKDHH